MRISFEPKRGTVMDYADEVQRLRQEYAETLRQARDTKREIQLFTRINLVIPEEMQDLMAMHAARLEEIRILLERLEAHQPIDIGKVVGHIGPEILKQAPDERVQYAIRAVKFRR